MKLDVVKNAKRNILFGIANKMVLVLCPFFTRTIIQMVLGAEYLGLNSLFSSILSVLSLTELGFGTAIVYNMYKPVAENDTATVCALLNLYKKVYRGIGIIVLIIGIFLIPFLPYLVQGAYPEGLHIRVLYLIYLIDAVISYFMYAYMSSLTIVYQREDVTSGINMCMTLLLHISQIVILFTCRNYYLFTVLKPVFTIANNLRIAYVVRKMFPHYYCQGVLSADLITDIKIRVRGAFLGKICMASRNTFDSIFISMFLGLTATAMYNNYYYIMYAVAAMLSVISSAFLGGLGNHVAIKSVEDNYSEFKKLNFIYMWLSGWCAICLFCLFQPFMKLWMGSKMMFPMPVIVLFCLYFYLLKTGDILSLYSSANGLWWEHRYRTLAEAMANLILNFALGKFFGIYGILAATNITIFICNFIWGLRITFKHYFQLSRLKEYYRQQIKYALVTLLLCSLTYGICMRISNDYAMIVLFLRMLVCIFVPNLFYIIIYSRSEMFSQTVEMLKESLKRKK